MKLTFRQISWLSQLHYGTDFVRGFSSLFKIDSLPHRMLDSTSKIIGGLDRVAGLALMRERKSWHMYTNVTVIQQGVRAHGCHLITLNEDFRNAVHVWQIGEHVVLWDADWHAGALCSVSSLDELAAEIIEHALAAIGQGSRAALGPDGLGPDGEKAPTFVSRKVAALTERLRVELQQGYRSALLYGPAGAGKTAASRQLVEALADSAMVVSSDMLSGRDTDVFSLICMWRPKAVVFDDIDRGLSMGNEGYILGGISRVRAVVPLVVATANVCDDFSGALLRPDGLTGSCISTVSTPRSRSTS